MSIDRRDQIWNAVYETHYDAAYQECTANKIITKWQFVDETTKVIVALTASGSAIAGWSMWQQDNMKVLWAIIAGLGALLAILHAALNVSPRLKVWGDSKRDFVGLRIDLETLKQRMTFDPEFAIDAFEDEYLALRKRYSESVQRLRDDILRTRALEIAAQKEVNSHFEEKGVTTL